MAKEKKEETKTKTETVKINPINLHYIDVGIKGTAPLVQNKFSHKAKNQMMESMATPSNEKKSRAARPPRDYDQDLEGAQHIFLEKVGNKEVRRYGIPAVAFKNAMIRACKAAKIVMTDAKMSLFILADGYDYQDGTALVKLNAGAPEKHTAPVRNDNGGADIRVRPMWREWQATIRVQFDADMINAGSIVNLLDRAGKQVGVGEGRNFSTNSCGQGWGSFEVVVKEEKSKRG